MTLPKEAVLEFMEIYKRKVHQTLNYNEAEIKAINLLSLFTLLTKNTD